MNDTINPLKVEMAKLFERIEHFGKAIERVDQRTEKLMSREEVEQRLGQLAVRLDNVEGVQRWALRGAAAAAVGVLTAYAKKVGLLAMIAVPLYLFATLQSEPGRAAQEASQSLPRVSAD